MRVAETHSTPGGFVTTGVYSLVRHPQYLGWLLAHVGASILASAQASLLFTPVLVAVVYVISRAEEVDLSEAFGDEYRRYQEKVPMLLPWPRKQWRGRRQAQKRIKA
jgi:protein-S-isoprenylcysteine O-methyltransferase Ste14